jgi:hypothetical protein
MPENFGSSLIKVHASKMMVSETWSIWRFFGRMYDKFN